MKAMWLKLAAAAAIKAEQGRGLVRAKRAKHCDGQPVQLALLRSDLRHAPHTNDTQRSQIRRGPWNG
jgi:hypothetical protein